MRLELTTRDQELDTPQSEPARHSKNDTSWLENEERRWVAKRRGGSKWKTKALTSCQKWPGHGKENSTEKRDLSWDGQREDVLCDRSSGKVMVWHFLSLIWATVTGIKFKSQNCHILTFWVIHMKWLGKREPHGRHSAPTPGRGGICLLDVVLRMRKAVFFLSFANIWAVIPLRRRYRQDVPSKVGADLGPLLLWEKVVPQVWQQPCLPTESSF